jgi:hypothetical protein
MTVCCGRWSVLWAGLAALLLARGAWAQGSPILPETRPVLAGPVSMYPTIALRDAGFDSNVYNVTASPKEDFTYTVSPRIYVVAPMANTRFVGIGRGDFVYYRTYKDQQSISGLFESRYEVVSPGLRPFAEVDLANRRERQGLEIDARMRQVQTTVLLGADIDASEITAVTAWVSRRKIAWDSEEEYFGAGLTDQLNYTTDVVAGGAKFRVTPLTTIVTSVEVRRDRFDGASLRDNDSVLGSASVDFDPSAAISGHAQLGFRALKPLSPSLTDFRGVAGSARLRYVLRDLVDLNVDARRDLDYSYDPLQPYYLESGGRLTVSYRVFGTLYLIGIGERRELRHQRLGESGFNGRREITRSGGAGVALQIRRQLRFEFVYERTTRSSNESLGRDYQRRRLFGSAAYGQ